MHRIVKIIRHVSLQLRGFVMKRKAGVFHWREDNKITSFASLSQPLCNAPPLKYLARRTQLKLRALKTDVIPRTACHVFTFVLQLHVAVNIDCSFPRLVFALLNTEALCSSILFNSRIDVTGLISAFYDTLNDIDKNWLFVLGFTEPGIW
jgi:hypothetical protein